MTGMNLLSLALGGLAAGSPNSVQTPLAMTPPALSSSPLSSVTGPATQSNRDSGMSGLLDLSSAMNALQQAASTQGTGTTAASDSTALQMPPLPQMPAPAKAPSVATDDHGQSNVVFSDPDDDDGALIH